MAFSLGDLILRVGASIEGFERAMGTVSDRLKAIDRDVNKSFGGFDKLGDRLTSVGKGLSAAITLPLIGVGFAAVKTSESLNTAGVSFTTMLGSAEKAADFLNQLKQFAAATPFEFPELVDAAKRMNALGFASKDVVPTLRIVGDAAAAFGSGKEGIDGIILALGQMQLKHRVLAQEMNQLTERGVDAWGFLAKEIGVSVPQAMKLAETGAISAADAVPAILKGMNQQFGGQMNLLAKTLTGTWSNFRDNITFVLADIGKTISPVLLDMLNAAMPLLDWAKQAAHWFGGLPEPVRLTALGIAALAAAIGPLLLAGGALAHSVTSIAAAIPMLKLGIGTLTGAFSAPVLAIAAVTVALTALGIWVYNNWDPIVSVVKQAWEGISDLWKYAWSGITGWLEPLWSGIKSLADSVFGAFAPFFKGLWDAVSSAFVTAWNGIGSFLSGVWGSIKDVAASVWGKIVEVFSSFIEWAKKIPGVSKLLSLDDAWASGKKFQEQVGKSTKAVADFQKGTVAAGKSTKDYTALVQKSTEAHEDHFKAVRDDSLETALLGEKVRAVASRQQEALRWLANLRSEEDRTKDATRLYGEELDRLNKAIQDEVSAHRDLLTVVPDVIRQLGDIKAPVDSYYDALDRAGIKSTATFGQIADEARATFETIANDPRATQFERDNAMLRMLKAQADAMRANSQQIPADMQKTMDALESTVSGKAPAVVQPFKDFEQEVQRSITDLSTSMVQSLFEGNGSFADKGIRALKGLGEAVLSQFITPATQAISKFIAGALTDLLSGKGFGGLLDSIKGIGSAIGGIFGGGKGGAASAASSSASSAGAASGGIGGAGSAASGGLSTALGFAGLGVSIASGIVSGFQNAHQETSLNAIEHNTRYSMMYLGERADGGILGVLFKLTDEVSFGANTKATEALKDAFLGFHAFIVPKLDDMLGATWDIRAAVNALLDAARSASQALAQMAISASQRQQTPSQITVNVNGATDPQSTANEVMRQLRAQGAFA